MSKKTRNSTQFAAFALPSRSEWATSDHATDLPGDSPLGNSERLADARLKPRKVAEREDYEEAGLVGRIIGRHPVGVFYYKKQLPEGQLLCQVRIFLFWVDGQLVDWPEKGQRESRWFDQAEAAVQVDEGGLAEIIRSAFTPAHPRMLIHKARARSSKLPLPLALR